MKTRIFSVVEHAMLLTFVLFAISCGSTPFTNRRQLQLVSNEQVLALSDQQYKQYIAQAKVIKGSADANMVYKVGSRLAGAVSTYYTNQGTQAELKNFNWEFNLVENKEANAFALPGGKVVVFTGILPITQTEEALAVVLGHEIAHAVAHHANERISQQIALEYGGQIATGIFSGNSQASKDLASAVFGLGGQYGVMLPYARKQESEADEIGLIIMSIAGYNPQVAIPFWTRMKQKGGSNGIPEFMSTHPTDQKRIDRLTKAMPTAMKYYEQYNHGLKDSSKQSNSNMQKSLNNNKDTKTSSKWTF